MSDVKKRTQLAFERLGGQKKQLTLDNFSDALENLGISLASDEIIALFQSIDVGKTGVINYADFVALLREESAEMEPLEDKNALFTCIDRTKTNAVSLAELTHYIHSTGADYTAEEIREMFNMADFDKDGLIRQGDLDVLISKTS